MDRLIIIKIMKKYYFLVLVFSTLVISCTEPFNIETKFFKDALIVEATITNELKHQEIKLSKSYNLEEDTPIYESNAMVEVIENDATTFTFSETKSGTYISDNQFQAKSGKTYQLKIRTSSGKSYESEKMLLTPSTQINDLYVTKELNLDGKEEIRFNINTYDPTGKSRYYRYTYEETYKISSPYWSPYDVVMHNLYSFDTIYDSSNYLYKVCYNTIKSNAIIQKETNSFTEDRITKFPVRKVLTNNFILTHRYSILVKQYVQSRDAFRYYQTLEKFSSNPKSLFSQIQPGEINNNIYSTSDKSDKVLGYFELASVSSKRIFVNFNELNIKEVPKYPGDCIMLAPEIVEAFTGFPVLAGVVKSGLWSFYDINKDAVEGFNGPYIMVKNECADCRTFGTTVKPSFWID